MTEDRLARIEDATDTAQDLSLWDAWVHELIAEVRACKAALNGMIGNARRECAPMTASEVAARELTQE